MCSICGILDFEGRGRDIDKMNASMRHRGPDSSGSCVCGDVSLGHNRLAVIDISNGAQPMSAVYQGKKYTIVYNGEIYNYNELKKELLSLGADMKTKSDTELVLWSYIIFREKCPEKLNGIFAFCVYCDGDEGIFLARDRFGIKPLFYTKSRGRFLFASEIKALFECEGVRARIDRRGLWELLYLAPATVTGSGVFSDIYELPPAHCGSVDKSGTHFFPYWRLQARELDESREEMIEHTRSLMCDAIRRQLVSDVPLCCFLSGGLDSSVICAVAQEQYKQNGRILSTYSFEYENNHLKTSLFQPNSDDDYALWLSRYLGTSHTVLTAPTELLARYLPTVAIMRDLPGQADIDSSLYYFCGEIKKNHTVALSGECSDEIFGGYPWFYREEMLERDFFPWIHSPRGRINLFRDEIVHADEGYAYISEIYKRTVKGAPTLESDTLEMKRSRVATCLSVEYFMTNLLARKDRMSMAHGLEVRVPFADHRILEYVYNLPWSVKFEGNVEKALLRNAMAPYLPDKILYRKKSPYPKTHNPEYEALVTKMLLSRLSDRESRLYSIVSHEKIESLLAGEDVTWYGQLMSRPQLIAWLIELDAWLEHYRVEICT